MSPALLDGPANGDYFSNLRGFPTPNESGLRTGLTPGGGGSMFPAPSPNSQAIFQQLQSGGATPGTLDFHRTALNAAARNKNNTYPTSNPQDPIPQQSNTNMDSHQDANDAANGLFMLAKGGQPNQFAVPNQPAPQPAMQTRNQDQKRNSRNNGSIGSMSGNDMGADDSPEQEDSKPAARGGRGKKNVKSEPNNNRRKSEASQKGGNKRAKGNSGSANVDPLLDPHDDDDDDDMSDGEDDMTGGPDTRKMTDEEKRRNFLERNRYASWTP